MYKLLSFLPECKYQQSICILIHECRSKIQGQEPHISHIQSWGTYDKMAYYFDHCVTIAETKGSTMVECLTLHQAPEHQSIELLREN